MTQATISELQLGTQAPSNNLPATAPIRSQAPASSPGFDSASNWDLAQRIAKAFAASDLVPQQYRGNIPNCLIALEMANRVGTSPLLVMQNLYVVHGMPGWSSKFLIACFNQCGRYSALRYEFDNNKDGKPIGCRAWAIEKSTKQRLVGATVNLDMARAEGWSEKSGSKWKTMPEQMLMYRSAAFMIRTYAPELSMGLRTVDEIVDNVIDMEDMTITELQKANEPAAPVAEVAVDA